MEWEYIMALFSCVAANYLGLIEAIEETIGMKIPIVNCSRCFSFWSVLLLALHTTKKLIPSLAVAFLCALLASWLELFLGFSDYLYNKFYDKIYSTTKNDKKEDIESCS